MKKILLLGARGTLGSALHDVLQSRAQYELLSFGREDLDVTAKDSVFSVVEKLRPDLVINTTSLNAVDAVETDEMLLKQAMAVNAHAVGYLAEACSRFGSVLIHYGTDFVFPGESETGYAEHDAPRPISKYGETKRKGEELLMKNTESYYLIRASRIFGQRGRSDGSKLSFVDLMMKYALIDGKKELNMVNNEVLSPTYAKDLAERTCRIWEDSMPFGIYHGHNEGKVTAYEMAQYIFSVAGIPMKLTPVHSRTFAQPAKRPEKNHLVNTKLPRQRTWQEAVDEYFSVSKESMHETLKMFSDKDLYSFFHKKDRETSDVSAQ